MSLIIDNPDWQGIREGLADEDFDFWELPDHLAYFYPLAGNGSVGKQYDAEAEELENLVEDYRRVREQARKMIELAPARENQIQQQLSTAVNEIERKIKKLLGGKISFTENNFSTIIS